MDLGIFKDWELDGFPKIGMMVDGCKKFYTLREAVPLYDSGWVRVELTNEVLSSDLSIRSLTIEESNKLTELTDEYSGSK